MLLLAVVLAFSVVMILAFNACRYGYKALLSPFFWISILLFLYLLVPSLFSPDISYYFDWGLSESSIFYSLLICASVAVFFAVMTLFFKPDYILRRADIWRWEGCSVLVKVIWGIVFCYLAGVLLFKWSMTGLSMTGSYTGEESDVFKLKSVAYFLVPVSVLAFFDCGRLRYFSPNLIIIVLDLLSGGRTVAFIVLIPIVISVCVYYKRLFVIPVFSVCALLVFVGVVRSDNVVKGVPAYIDAIAEFRETFVTLPLFIERADYVGRGDAYTLAALSVVGVLQPFRDKVLATVVSPGYYIYEMVNRGYGLGANIITDALYYGYLFVPLTLGVVFLFCLAAFFVLSKLRLPDLVVVVSFLVVFFRLVVREGFYFNFGLFVFIFLVYCFPVLLLNRVRFSFFGFSDKGSLDAKSS